MTIEGFKCPDCGETHGRDARSEALESELEELKTDLESEQQRADEAIDELENLRTTMDAEGTKRHNEGVRAVFDELHGLIAKAHAMEANCYAVWHLLTPELKELLEVLGEFDEDQFLEKEEQ